MPRLGSFLICEKIIQDQLGKPTLIAIFQKVGTVVPDGQEVPKGAMAGIAWAAFTEWFFTEDEHSKTFHQVLEVVLPDGSPSPLRGRLQLAEISKDGLGSRCFINMMGVPISQAGFISVKVWLECGSERITDVFSYPIQIEHAQQLPTPNHAGSFVLVPGPNP